jgi:hypothetical protein
VPYRDDLVAALARNAALERRIVEVEAELRRARTPVASDHEPVNDERHGRIASPDRNAAFWLVVLASVIATTAIVVAIDLAPLPMIVGPVIGYMLGQGLSALFLGVGYLHGKPALQTLDGFERWSTTLIGLSLTAVAFCAFLLGT